MTTFNSADLAYDRMLAAGPPEPPLFTVSYQAQVFAEGPYDNPTQVEAWLREHLGKQATITFLAEDETVHFVIDDEVEEVENEDHAREVVENLIVGGEHQLVLDGIEIQVPEPDEPDGDAIAKDRRIKEDW